MRLVYPEPGSGSPAAASPAGASPGPSYPTDASNRILIRVLAPHIPAPMEAWFDRSAGHGEISGIPPGARIVVEVDEYDNTARALFTGAPLLGRGWTQGVSLAAGQFKTVDVTMYDKGTIATFCGSGAAGDSGDGGLAAGAALNRPLSVKVGPGDEVFVASTGARRIRKIDRYGFISHYAGNGSDGAIDNGMAAATAPIGQVYDMDFDPAGNLYFINWTQQIAMISKNTSEITVRYVGQSPEIFAKPDLGVENDNSIFYSNFIDNVVYSISGGSRSSFVFGNQPYETSDGANRLHYPVVGPTSTSFFRSGPTLFFVDQRDHQIKGSSWILGTNVYSIIGRVDGNIFFEGIDPLALSLSFPFWVESDNFYRNLFYREQDYNRIRVLRPADNRVYSFAGGDLGGYSGDGGPAAAARLNDPAGVAVDARGNVYIADTGNHAIRVVIGGALP